MNTAPSPGDEAAGFAAPSLRGDRVYIRVSDGAAELVEPLEFRSFSVRATELTPVDGAVRFDSAEQAWVSAAWLLAQEPYASDPAARDGVHQMIDYARTKGWVDEAGDIAAHIERDQVGTGDG